VSRVSALALAILPPRAERRMIPAPTEAMPFSYTTNLSEVRALAENQARMAGLPDARIADFVIAVGEVAANTVRHAKSAGSMEIWCDDGEIVCEMRDAGVITDPQAGRHAPRTDAGGGHGLWLVYQVCDRVDLHSDENGTVIRMHMSLP
jgi:anti-sigma regulatory factor (Ser/Thr protein kinase)